MNGWKRNGIELHKILFFFPRPYDTYVLHRLCHSQRGVVLLVEGAGESIGGTRGLMNYNEIDLAKVNWDMKG